MKMLEAQPRFAEELSRNFFKKYPELLTEVHVNSNRRAKIEKFTLKLSDGTRLSHHL